MVTKVLVSLPILLSYLKLQHLFLHILKEILWSPISLPCRGNDDDASKGSCYIQADFPRMSLMEIATPLCTRIETRLSTLGNDKTNRNYTRATIDFALLNVIKWSGQFLNDLQVYLLDMYLSGPFK